MKGKGGFTMTGQIGQVMQESMQAALTWVRSNAAQLGIAEDFFADHDIHMHVPAGAIPKDGPSAGVTMATTLVSLLSGHRIRPLTAMTGEITLSGNVLPVGGIKEKVLAAKRAGVTTIILPAENRMNVQEDLTPEQIEGLDIHYVKTIEEALRVSLPVVAESLAAKVFMETESTAKPKDSKSEPPPIRPIQEPAVVHDKVVTWQS
jgi:ATP-dependent Lon protease